MTLQLYLLYNNIKTIFAVKQLKNYVCCITTPKLYLLYNNINTMFTV